MSDDNPITPAAQRLYDARGGAVLTNLRTCQEIVDVVFNLPRGADGTDLVDRMAAALKATLTMMNGNQEQWTKMARQIVVRAGLEEENISDAVVPGSKLHSSVRDAGGA